MLAQKCFCDMRYGNVSSNVFHVVGAWLNTALLALISLNDSKLNRNCHLNALGLFFNPKTWICKCWLLLAIMFPGMENPSQFYPHLVHWSFKFKIFEKYRFLVKIFENLDFGEEFLNTSILVKIVENIDLDKIFEKERFWSKLAKISSLVKIFEKPQFYSKHLDFGPNFRTSRFWSKFLKNLNWPKFSKYLDFRQNLEKSRFASKSLKISIFVKIFEISWLWSKFLKNLVWVKVFKESTFWSKFSKYLDFGQIFEKSQLMSNFRKFRTLVQLFEK